MFQWIKDQMRDGKDNFTSSVMAVLDDREIHAAFPGFTRRERIYHLVPLLKTFLAQVMHGASCREAIAMGIGQEWLPPSASPGNSAYCNARTALPETPLRDLALSLGRSMSAAMPNSRRFMGRPVKVFDGSSVQLPDSPANQAPYPQPSAQAEGCGFPVMCFAAMMDLDTGGMEDVEAWGIGVSERTGFRRLWRSMKKGDIALGDGGLGSFADVAMLLKRGVDSVFEAGQRKFDLPTGDHLVTLNRPNIQPHWVTARQLPETLDVRVIRFRPRMPGCRPRVVTLMTTLMDKARYPKRVLMGLYRRRWEMELRLRDIKTTMGLEALHAKTPAGCRKELWMGLLGYNMIRMTMLAAAQRVDCSVEGFSFAGTLQRLRAFSRSASVFFDHGNGWLFLLDHLALDMLPYRPNRIEPRKLKRRRKNYRLLNRPRQVERRQLLRA